MPRLPRLTFACAIAIAAALLPAAGAEAAGWLPMTTALNGTNGQIGQPRVAVDDAGNTYAVWTEGGMVEASKRPVGGAFETPQTIDTAANGAADGPDIGVDGAGNAVVVWRTHAAAGGRSLIMLARRAAGAGSFVADGAPLSNINDLGVATPRIDVNRAGTAFVAFESNPTSSFAINVALGSTTGAFTLRSNTETATPGNPTVDINEAGDAAAVWTEIVGSNPGVRAFYLAHGTALASAPFENVSGTTPTKADPHVALDSAGRAVAVWTESTNGNIAAWSRPAAATTQTWTHLNDLDKPGSGGGSPRIAFETGDAAVAGWAGDGVLRSSTRPAGATDFGAAQPYTDASEQPGDLDVNSVSGTTALVWSGTGTPFARAMVRTGGGAFSPIATLTPAGHGGTQPDVNVAPTGNASAVWVDSSPVDQNLKLASAVYDATAPSLTGTTVPPTATTGQAVAMSATATDDWSTPAIGWNFGDGAIAFGNSVSHTYTAPGTYDLSATAIDSAGNTQTTNGTIVVSNPPVDEPTRGVDFNASSVSGKVLVSVPKNAPAGRVLARKPVARSAAAISPPHGYTPFRLLGKDDNIPVGSILDASKGTSSITMAANPGGTVTQKGQFSLGVFKTKQTKKSPLTTATMMGGGNFKRDCKAPKARAGSAGVQAARRRPSRRLFANVKGRFRTRGRHSTATVRGTKYLVKDSCSGTTTRVIKGTVVVRDLVKHKNHVVRAGHRFIARPRNFHRRHH